MRLSEVKMISGESQLMLSVSVKTGVKTLDTGQEMRDKDRVAFLSSHRISSFLFLVSSD